MKRMFRNAFSSTMGTWGSGSFENDAAMDWIGDFADEPTFSRLQTTLKDASGLNDEEAIAAVELVAALNGRPSADFDGLDEAFSIRSVNLKPDGDLLKSSLLALGRIERDSELKDRWNEAGAEEASQWLSAIRELQARLTP